MEGYIVTHASKLRGSSLVQAKSHVASIWVVQHYEAKLQHYVKLEDKKGTLAIMSQSLDVCVSLRGQSLLAESASTLMPRPLLH